MPPFLWHRNQLSISALNSRTNASNRACQVGLLRSDNVATPDASGLGTLGISPRLLTETIAELLTHD